MGEICSPAPESLGGATMPEHGRAVATHRDADHLDVFMRSPEGTLIHIWGYGGVANAVDSAIDLGGDLDSDPVAIRRWPKGMDVFALSMRKTVLHWSWDVTTGLWRMPEDLPGLVVTEPRAVADDDTLYVFAKSVDGPIRWWMKTGAGRWGARVPITSPNHIESDPVVVRRGTGVIDVYFNAKHQIGVTERDKVTGSERVVQKDVFTVDTVTIANGTASGATSLRTGNFAQSGHAIAAFSWEPRRQDVFVRAQERKGPGIVPGTANGVLVPGLPDGALIHWGSGFVESAKTQDGWWGPEKVGPEGALLDFDPIAVSRGVGDADIFFRDRRSELHHWSWEGSPLREWVDRGSVSGRFASNPVAVARNKDTMELVLRTGDYAVQVWRWQVQRPRWEQFEWKASFFKQAPPQDPLAGSTDDEPPEFLIIRPEDHLLVGLNAPTHELNDGFVPQLTNGHGPVRVTFPPQHIAEETSRADEPAPASRFWLALLSGPSRVSLNASSTLMLTAEGILAGLDDNTVDSNEDASAIELPRGLIFAPRSSEAEQQVMIRHPTTPIGRDGTFGLWRTRFGTAEGDGGLRIKGVNAGRDDGFVVALPKADRVLIAEQDTPASADRLELSSLGGTLTASGRWDEFEWDHRAILGRDHIVRTALKGVLYPFGHRAVWVQMTERSDDEDIAVLRKTNTLYVVEPLVRPGVAAPAELRRAFPFSEVELATREYRNLDEAHWTNTARSTRQVAELEARCAELNREMFPIHAGLFNGAYQFGLTTELLAEVDGDAGRYLKLYADRQRIQRAIDLLTEEGLGTVDIPTFFMPTNNAVPMRFPIRCRAANGDVHVTVPLIFVADLDLGGDLRPPFTTLTDPRVAAALHKKYTTQGHGVVQLPGVPIDLTPADPPVSTEAQTTVHEVRRLNIVGNLAGRGYLPSLGLPGDPLSWAADVAVPTIRSLVGTDPTARVTFTGDYLQGVANDVPLQIKGEVVDAAQNTLKDLEVDFTGSTDRAGGLAAPKMIVDRVSQVHGLVNAAGAQSLDPRDLFVDGASLLGFDLRDLVQSNHVPPELKTIVRDGMPNEVRMTWEGVGLKASPAESPMFSPTAPTSTVSIAVVSSADRNETTCTVTDFKLRMPPGDDDALIEFTFGMVKFHQVQGQAPSLKVEITDIAFVGKLRLLNELRKVIGVLKDLPVKVDASRDRVVARYALPLPDASALGFVISNALFSAALTVPFSNDESVSVGLGFASRQRPFTLTVLMFGGGGYVDLELIHSGLRRLEISLQFGAAIGMNFGVGHAEVHAFGGIRYALVSGAAVLTGYLHIGGSLDILGLVSVAIELRVELAYDSEANHLVGRATIVVDIDVTLYSDSFELDSGEWVIAGGSGAEGAGHRRLAAPHDAASDTDDAGVAAWQAYRSAFA
ncbi:hypothetical protein [Mycobacterium sp.]|uniref:hypothetical protein n=1 Tax=Mycobacterium sp. TaxID=1785 RepID=UPI002D9EF6F7|nr:hypothetical protein [Mycobacterium sp.]